MKHHPNILFITADQLRKDALGCYGNDTIRTPHLDTLAKQGVRFERMFAAHPVCAPNRASIATGRYPSVHRLCLNGKRMPSSELTLMEVLRRAGYATCGAGKMHFGPQWPFPPDNKPIMDPDLSTGIDPQPLKDAFPWYGFEEAWLTEDHRIGPYARYLAEHGYDLQDELNSATYPQHATVCPPFPEEHHQTTWITQQAQNWLEQHDSRRPFFLWVSYVHPHHPFNPPKPYDTMYDPADMPLPVRDPLEMENWPEVYKKKYLAAEGQGGHEAVGMCHFSDKDWQRIKAYYYGMITQIDCNINRLMETLGKMDLLDNTIVIFTSDHGENMGDHGLLFKGTTYDCVTNVPFIVSQPGRIPCNTRRDLLASSIDIMPTVLDLAGVSHPDPNPMQGASLAPALTNACDVLREAVLIENDDACRSVRTDDALLTWHSRDTQGELYDLKIDPDCFCNLWDRPEAAKLQSHLMQILVKLMAENHDPLPLQEGPW